MIYASPILTYSNTAIAFVQPIHFLIKNPTHFPTGAFTMAPGIESRPPLSTASSRAAIPWRLAAWRIAALRPQRSRLSFEAEAPELRSLSMQMAKSSAVGVRSSGPSEEGSDRSTIGVGCEAALRFIFEEFCRRYLRSRPCECCYGFQDPLLPLSFHSDTYDCPDQSLRR